MYKLKVETGKESGMQSLGFAGPTGFHPVGEVGSFPTKTSSFPLKGRGKKEKRRERKRERGGGSVYVFGA